MKKILIIIYLFSLFAQTTVGAPQFPPNYLVVFYNNVRAEFYCTYIVGDTYHLYSTMGVQMSISRADLQKILVYPANVGMIKGM